MTSALLTAHALEVCHLARGYSHRRWFVEPLSPGACDPFRRGRIPRSRMSPNGGARFVYDLHGASEGPKGLKNPIPSGPVATPHSVHDCRAREPSLKLSSEHPHRFGRLEVALRQRDLSGQDRVAWTGSRVDPDHELVGRCTDQCALDGGPENGAVATDTTGITRGKAMSLASSGLVRTTATQEGIRAPGRRLSVGILRSRSAPARSE